MTLSQADLPAIDRVVELLGRARRLLFITGAGLSADSGLPTYRGPTGLYESGRMTVHGVRIEEVLSGEMFATRPEVRAPALPAMRGTRPPGRRPLRRGAAGGEAGAALVGVRDGFRPGLQRRDKQPVPLHRSAGAAGAAVGVNGPESLRG
jgi:hypothetical protein